MSDNGTPKKEYDVSKLGIEETDSCPVCKRQLKGLVEEHDGGYIFGKGGEWVCLGCGSMFVPKSMLKKIVDKMEKESLILKPKIGLVPGGRNVIQ